MLRFSRLFTTYQQKPFLKRKISDLDITNVAFNNDSDIDVSDNEDTNVTLTESNDSFAFEEESNVIENELDKSQLYSKDFLNDDLFHGSDYCVGDFLVVMNVLRSNYNISDGLQNDIVGAFASLLPKDNALLAQLECQTKSSYYFQKLQNSIIDDFTPCSFKCYIVCLHGCIAFEGPHINASSCPICHCIRNLEKPNKVYHFPFKERMMRLLNSNYKKLLLHPRNRKEIDEKYYEDIYDGLSYQWFESEMLENEIFVGLQWCWDGAQSFSDQSLNKPFWPSSISILNFPIDLRSKMYIGMHLVTLCTGNNYSLRLLVQDLNELWIKGIIIDDVTYKFAIVNAVWDGAAFQDVTRTQGSKSLAGCNVCTFEGVTFADRVVYPSYSRYV